MCKSHKLQSMKTLNRYILSEISNYFILCLLALTGLLLTIRLLKFASLIINKGVELSQIATVFIAIIPTFLELAIPMSALLGVMLAFARLSGDSEIIVIRASGISLRQVLRPVAYFAVFAALLGFVVSFFLKPWGHQTLERSLFEIARSRSTAGLTQGVFNPLGDLTLYADTIDYRTGDLKNVIIEDRRAENSRRIITAKEGRIPSTADKPTINFMLFNGEIHESVEDKYVTTDYTTNAIVLATDEIFPEKEEEKRKSRSLSQEELDERLNNEKKNLEMIQKGKLPESLRASDLQDARKRVVKRIANIELEFAKRFSLPFAALILAFVAMPLGIQPPRTQKTWGTGLSTILGMAVFIFYFALLTLGSTLAESGTIPAIIGAWIPNVICAAFAIYLLQIMSSEKWQTAAEGLGAVLQGLSRVWNRRKKAGQTL